MRRVTTWVCIVACWAWSLPLPAGAQAPAQAQQQAAKTTYVFNAATEIVLVNISVRDAKGNLVTDLKKDEVQILEDGKPQNILSFDFENVDTGLQIATDAGTTGPESTMSKGAGPTKPATPAASAATPAAAPTDTQYRDKRLMVMYFDLTTMQPEDIQAAVESAQNYVRKQMMPADLVAIATLGNSLQVNEDFTADKDVLLRDLDGLNPSASAGFADGLEAATDGSGVSTDMTADDGNTFEADDTEFNVANADRSLEALMTISEMLAPIQQKKSVLFFSDGITRSGTDNELTLRSAVNAAVKANVSIYTLDARGLIAQVPGGSANTASMRGSSVYSGKSTVQALNSTFASQETIQTLANDTGGAAFLDSNDFAPVYTRIQDDTKAYYLLSYTSTNKLRDGKYRKITVKITRPSLANAKIDARKGYYAPTDINHMSSADREGQLEDQLSSDAPDQQLDLYAADGFIRLDKGLYLVPMAIVVPGNEIPLTTAKPNQTPTVDFAGFVEDRALRQLNHMNQDVSLNVKTVGNTKELATKNLQYNAFFQLTPGSYHIRMAARENQVGQMGSFETYVQIPDLDATADPTTLQTSSVLVGSQLSAAKPDPKNPLIQQGTMLVQSVTKVFASNQHMYMFFEVYNPKPNPDGKLDVHVNAAFYSGKVRVFETPVVVANSLTDAKREAVTFQLDIPLNQLQPGPYTLQVNAIDQVAQKFSFPRLPILILAPAGVKTTAAPAPGGGN